jgi:predicted nuclease of predicted toxin-antitoxin system
VRWLADECVHCEVVDALRAEGRDVLYAAEFHTQSKDTALAAEALKEGRLLLTEDKDFREIVYRPALSSAGVVRLRFATSRRARKWSCLRRAIEEHGDDLYKRFTVITESRVRSRALVRRSRLLISLCEEVGRMNYLPIKGSNSRRP